MKLASSLSAAAAAAAFCFVMDWNVSDDEAIDCRIMRTPSEKFEECLQECFPLFLSYFLWLCECVCVCVCVLIQSFVWCINDCGSDAGLAAQRSWNIHFPSYYYPPPPLPVPQPPTQYRRERRKSNKNLSYFIVRLAPRRTWNRFSITHGAERHAIFLSLCVDFQQKKKLNNQISIHSFISSSFTSCYQYYYY